VILERIIFISRGITVYAKCTFVMLNHTVGQLVLTTVLTIWSQLSQKTTIIH